MGRRLVGWVAAGAALYALATVALTWPLFRHPGKTVLDTVSLYGDAAILIQRDINLTLWMLAWDTHALLTDPLHLFHANAFYPAPYTLALSEHELGNVPWFAPVYLLTANPVLAYQATVLMTFVLAGLAMAAYVFYWTEDRAVALASGFLYAFAPFRFWQLGSLSYISIQWLPLVALGVDLVLDRRGGRLAACLLGAALALSGLCSVYMGYAAFVLAGCYAWVGLQVRGPAARARLLPLALAFGAAAAVVAVTSIPYLLLQQSGVLPDYGAKKFTSLAFLSMMKWGLGGVLSFYVVPRRDGIPAFLTYTVLALAAGALLAPRRPPRSGLLVVGLAGLILALGPFLYVQGFPELPLPYSWLAAVVPGFSAMRSPQRFGVLPVLAVTALAGLALFSARKALTARGFARTASLVPWLAVAAMLFEATPRGLRPLAMPTRSELPAAYQWLAAHGEGGPLLELPANPLHHHRESLFLYFSTYHWLPLVNGYSGYPPRSYREIMDIATELPAPGVLETLLARVRPRWILLHRPDLPFTLQPYEERLRSALRVVADFGETVLFEVPPAPVTSK